MKNRIKDIKKIKNKFYQELGIELKEINLTSYKIFFIFDMDIKKFARIINLKEKSLLDYIGFTDKFIPINYSELEDEEYSTIDEVCMFMNNELNKRIEKLQDEVKKLL